MKILELKKERRKRRKKHVRNIVKGSENRPRLSITRSLKHIYAQIIDDVNGKTLVSASTVDKEIKTELKAEMPKIAQAKLIGLALAKRALDAKIETVTFDRNGFLYHGRVKALADSARKAGLKF